LSFSINNALGQIALFSIGFVTYKMTTVAVKLRIDEEDQAVIYRAGGMTYIPVEEFALV
jgi:hypothetical protein